MKVCSSKYTSATAVKMAKKIILLLLYRKWLKFQSITTSNTDGLLHMKPQNEEAGSTAWTTLDTLISCFICCFLIKILSKYSLNVQITVIHEVSMLCLIHHGSCSKIPPLLPNLSWAHSWAKPHPWWQVPGGGMCLSLQHCCDLPHFTTNWTKGKERGWSTTEVFYMWPQL